jgi:hypothetical protein
MGTTSIKFSVERLLAFRTSSNLEDRSFLPGYFPLGSLPSLRLRSPVYSLVPLGRDPNPGIIHRVSGTWGSLRAGATAPQDGLTLRVSHLLTIPVGLRVLIVVAIRTTPHLVGSPIRHPEDEPDRGYRILHGR